LAPVQRFPVFIAALWWGSLTAVGFLVVPLLFMHLPTPQIAGQMAAKLFSAQTWVAVVCGLLFLLFSRSKWQEAGANTQSLAMGFVVCGMLLALLVEFAVAPRIVARENLKLWHGVGSAMFVLQWMCASGLLWKVAPRR
jgi:hypothetical protein